MNQTQYQLRYQFPKPRKHYIDYIRQLKTRGYLRTRRHDVKALNLAIGVNRIEAGFSPTMMTLRYQKPMITAVSEVIPLTLISSAPPTASPAIGIPCGILTARGYTQSGYLKIADIYTADGTRFYVLTHEHLGGKLYRKPDEVSLQDSKKAAA